MNNEINAETIITKGLPLSKNFLIDHLSTGAYHFVMGKWAPLFSSPITPQSANGSQQPLWKSALSLQQGAIHILEPLLQEFGGDLILRSGFNPSSMGQSFDIQVDGMQNNMYNIMPTLQKLLPKASGLSLFQGGNLSFSRISFDQFSTQIGTLKELPSIKSFDLLSGSSFDGLKSFSGFI